MYQSILLHGVWWRFAHEGYGSIVGLSCRQVQPEATASVDAIDIDRPFRTCDKQRRINAPSPQLLASMIVDAGQVRSVACTVAASSLWVCSWRVVPIPCGAHNPHTVLLRAFCLGPPTKWLFSPVYHTLFIQCIAYQCYVFIGCR